MNFDPYEDIPAQIIKLNRENAADYEEELLNLWLAAIQTNELDINETGDYARKALFFTLGYLPELFPIVLNWTISAITRSSSTTNTDWLSSILNELSYAQKQFLPEIRQAFLDLIQNDTHFEIKEIAARNLIPSRLSDLDSTEPSHKIIAVLLAQASLWHNTDFSEQAISAIEKHISHAPDLLDQAKAFIQECLKSQIAEQKTAALRLAGKLRHMDVDYFAELGKRYTSDPEPLVKYAAQCLITPPVVDNKELMLATAYSHSDMPQHISPTEEGILNQGTAMLFGSVDLDNKAQISILDHEYKKAENESMKYLAKFSNGDPYAIMKYAECIKHMHRLLERIKKPIA